MFDCKKMHSKCQAGCCGIVPIEKEIWDRNQEKLVSDVLKTQTIESVRPFCEQYNLENIIELVIPETKNDKCPFLNKDFSCNIYEDRPEICRRFGNESCLNLTCVYQAKDGRERSRQEKRGIERKIVRQIENLLKVGE